MPSVGESLPTRRPFSFPFILFHTIAPVKRASIHNHPANRRPVPPNPFGSALDDDVRAVLLCVHIYVSERADEEGQTMQYMHIFSQQLGLPTQPTNIVQEFYSILNFLSSTLIHTLERTWIGRQMAPQPPKVLSTISGIPCFFATALSSVKRGMLYCRYRKEGGH